MAGYASSVMYLMSRLFQIYKNRKRRSAEGLALAMFCTAIAANSLYGSSILLRSYTMKDLLSALPWLLGSLGCIGLDVIIFLQVSYGNNAPLKVIHVNGMACCFNFACHTRPAAAPHNLPRPSIRPPAYSPTHPLTHAMASSAGNVLWHRRWCWQA
jgi:hypothetical protein